ncbi:glycine zipper 2TM domain-containing protein [Noviherbaspirillum sp.]|uniref:glycine zipper 2TM domain-containing protein n=1 Tax=Noviherbaspirillum sp. TaxID=1926288 RepID=UPI002B49B554|nr:glycine zipper 2TM domain-containing protein [Noviherbaspirillum sp.]HJV80233.1 glycine zipper 2TM domain-containing protein [Noviherbaspirillum sp.]
MEANQSSKRIHPLMAGAAASVMLVSLVGTAAMTGILPSSQGTTAPAASVQPVAATADNKTTTAPVQAQTPAPAVAQYAPPPSYQQPARTVHRTHVVHHTTTASAQPVTYAPPAPAPAPQPVAQNSPVGIGVGAVVGGLLGNQVGRGNGRTLATIAGAIGGGYVGNEIAKKNQ